MPDIQDRFMEMARGLRQGILWNSNASIERLALALQEQHEAGRREEREECAKLADEERAKHSTGSGFDSQPARVTAWNIGAAIRSRT